MATASETLDNEFHDSVKTSKYEHVRLLLQTLTARSWPEELELQLRGYYRVKNNLMFPVFPGPDDLDEDLINCYAHKEATASYVIRFVNMRLMYLSLENEVLDETTLSHVDNELSLESKEIMEDYKASLSKWYDTMKDREIKKFTAAAKDLAWCPPIFDNWLCWPPTPPGHNMTLDCPPAKGLVTGGKAYRLCMEDGRWEKYDEKYKPKGYTHYDDCIIPKLKDLMKMCNEIEQCTQIARITRNLEMVGLSFSLVSLIISLYIFFHYRILKNNRTKIHKNLFIATLLQVVFRLINYVDQGFKDENRLIEQTPYLNETCIALLEYTKTAMFMWMFIEGLYLHNMITVTVFQEYSYIKLYFYVGWLAPFIMTAAWVITMVLVNRWAFYFLLPYYWILEGPRSTIILVNLLFLINIIRVLIVKLRESQTSEIEQVRKAVRAAIFLLPLMGIANILFWVDYRFFTEAWKFALWSYTSYFLNTFQGFFMAVLYCFLNGEVQAAIKNSFYLHMSLRNHDYAPCRNFTLISTAPEPDQPISNGDGPHWIQHCLKHLGRPSAEDLPPTDTTNMGLSNGESDSTPIEEDKNFE